MKARVTVSVFRDKVTGTYHERGAVIDLSKNRFQEVSAKGLVEAVGRSKKSDDEDVTDEQSTDSAEEPEPSSMSPASHEYEGLAYIETPIKVNKVQSRGLYERQQTHD